MTLLLAFKTYGAKITLPYWIEYTTNNEPPTDNEFYVYTLSTSQ